MSQPHASRGHATWSASASDRRWACPGSLAMEADAPPDKESHAAAWGTAAHEVAEQALRRGEDCNAQIGRVIETKSHKIEVDDEIAECAQYYVDYVNERHEHYASQGEVKRFLEQKFDLGKIDPPFQSGGTGDGVFLAYGVGEIEIIDLKGGRGHVVEALGNKQLRTYGLGALLANPGPWDTIRVTIVQPRAPHKDGIVRSETFSLVYLLGWANDLLEAMRVAKAGVATFDDGHRENWVKTYLTPGNHCTFCRAKPVCPALEARALEVAQTHFKDETAPSPPAPESLSVEQMVRILDHADMIQGWLNAVRAHAQDLAESGVEIAAGDSRYVLTEKRATRQWVGEVEEALGKLAEETGENVADLYQAPKPMSPAMAEKFLGKPKFREASKGLVESKSSGLNLTRADKTTRQAVMPPAQQHFKVEKGD